MVAEPDSQQRAAPLGTLARYKALFDPAPAQEPAHLTPGMNFLRLFFLAV
jgi:hypothetical protein